MDVDAVLADTIERVREQVPGIVEGLSEEDLSWRPDPGANSIAWLVWHLSRVADDHVAEVAGTEQVWTADGWFDKFGLPFPAEEHGWGHSPEQVGQVRASGALLTGYHDAVCEFTLRYLATLSAADLDRIVDERWDPPVSLGVRLVSVVNDLTQHAGQAAYVRGMLDRR